MKIFLSLLFVISFGMVVAQDGDSLVLENISKADVVYETDQAKLLFSKEDMLKDVEAFKEDYSFPDEQKKKEWNLAIEFLKKSKNKIELTEKKEYQQKELKALADLIEIRVGASLINQKKVEIIRKANNEKQKIILVRILIGTPDGSAYLYSFTDKVKVFYGEVFGEMLLFQEE